MLLNNKWILLLWFLQSLFYHGIDVDEKCIVIVDKALILVLSDCESGLLQSLDLSSLPHGRSIAYSVGCVYMFLIYCFYHLTFLSNNFYGLSTLVGCWLSVFIRRNIYKFLNVCPFNYIAFAVSGEVGITETV